MTQAGPICVLALALVPVLLLGEIDLSAGVAGSTGAMATGLLIVDHGQGWVVATLTAIVVGAVIGGWLAGILGISIGSGFIGSVIVAVVGAVILLFVIRLFKRAA